MLHKLFSSSGLYWHYLMYLFASDMNQDSHWSNDILHVKIFHVYWHIRYSYKKGHKHHTKYIYKIYKNEKFIIIYLNVEYVLFFKLKYIIFKIKDDNIK